MQGLVVVGAINHVIITSLSAVTARDLWKYTTRVNTNVCYYSQEHFGSH